MQAPPWQRGRGRGRQQRDERGTADIHPWRQHQLASLLPGSAASLSHTVALWAPRDLAPREPCRPPLGRTTFSRSHSACTPSSSCSCRRSSTCAATLTHLSPLLVARPALTPLSPLPHTALPTCCVCSPRPSRRARAPRQAAALPAALAAPIAAAAVAVVSRAVAAAAAAAATSEARAPQHCCRPTAPPPHCATAAAVATTAVPPCLTRACAGMGTLKGAARPPEPAPLPAPASPRAPHTASRPQPTATPGALACTLRVRCIDAACSSGIPPFMCTAYACMHTALMRTCMHTACSRQQRDAAGGRLRRVEPGSPSPIVNRAALLLCPAAATPR